MTDWREELRAAYRLMRMGQSSCPALKRMLDEGKGGFHYADAVIRKDAHDYHLQADWIAHFARAWAGLREEVIGYDYDEKGERVSK